MYFDVKSVLISCRGSRRSRSSRQVDDGAGTMGAAGHFGDTTLTKVFIGGLAWETQKEVMKEHFEKHGEILEAVIISDKATGRSKGYGFVTFKDAESAKRACEDATPVINGRRANCNLASLGARRQRLSPVATPPPGPTLATRPIPTTSQNGMHWYYPTGGPPSPYQRPHHGIAYHAYGYSPNYVADMSYNQKVSYYGSYLYPSRAMVSPNSMMPMHPYYPVHHHQSMAVPTHIYPTTTAVPSIVSKPTAIAAIPPNAGMRMQLNVSE